MPARGKPHKQGNGFAASAPVFQSAGVPAKMQRTGRHANDMQTFQEVLDLTGVAGRANRCAVQHVPAQSDCSFTAVDWPGPCQLIAHAQEPTILVHFSALPRPAQNPCLDPTANGQLRPKFVTIHVKPCHLQSHTLCEERMEIAEGDFDVPVYSCRSPHRGLRQQAPSFIDLTNSQPVMATPAATLGAFATAEDSQAAAKAPKVPRYDMI